MTIAVNAGLIIVPIKLEDIPLEGPMEFFLSDTHWLDAMNPPTQKEINKLVKTIKSLLLNIESGPDFLATPHSDQKLLQLKKKA